MIKQISTWMADVLELLLCLAAVAGVTLAVRFALPSENTSFADSFWRGLIIFTLFIALRARNLRSPRETVAE